VGRLAALWSARILLVLSLLAAALDVPLPRSTPPRRRLHLIDRSASVLVGPKESFRPDDAAALARADRVPRGETLLASFGRKAAWDSDVVDASSTDLAGALAEALGRNPTEIVLYTDGRADPGASLLLCAARGVPVHVYPLGPSSVRDARIARVDAPGEIDAGGSASVEVSVVSTFSTDAKLRLGGRTRGLTLAPGAPQSVVFDRLPAGTHPIELEVDDEVAENNRSSVTVLERGARRRILSLSGARFDVPGFDVETRREPLEAFSAVVHEGPAPPAEELAGLARYVRNGGGLLLFGGPRGFAKGGWKDTALDAMSPLSAVPEHRVSVVFAVDVSGSMEGEKLERVKRAAEDARDFFNEGEVLPMAFAGHVTWLGSWAELRRTKSTGATRFVEAVQGARTKLAQARGRKHILLLTDGIAAKEEKPEDRRAAVEALKGEIGLTVITIDRPIPEFPVNVPADAGSLETVIRTILAGIRDVERANARVDPQPHPALAGVGPFDVPLLNLTAERPGSEVAATHGRAPALYRAVAFRAEVHGRVGALAFERSACPPRLLAQALDHVAGPAARGPRLSADPPFVRARGSWTAPRLRARAGGVDFDLLQVRSDLWEGRLPDGLSGALVVLLPETGARMSLTIPGPREFEHLGIDRTALERIARETLGRMLSTRDSLAELPPPPPAGASGGRAVFLLLSLVLIFADLAVTTFWKTA
jgi:hypothetical protein